MFLSLGRNKSRKPDDMSSGKRKKTKQQTSKQGKSKPKKTSASDNSSDMTAVSETPDNIAMNGNESTVENIKKIPHDHVNVDQETNHVTQNLDSLNPKNSNESNTATFHIRGSTGPPSEPESVITEGSGENALSDVTALTEEEKGNFGQREGWGGYPKDNIPEYYNSNHFPDVLKSDSITSGRRNEELQNPITSLELNDEKFSDQRSNLFEDSKNFQDIDESESLLTPKGFNTSLSSVTAPRGLPLELFSDNLYIGPIDQLPPMGLAFYWLGWYTEAVFSQTADGLSIVDRFTGIPLSKLFLWIYSPKNLKKMMFDAAAKVADTFNPNTDVIVFGAVEVNKVTGNLHITAVGHGYSGFGKLVPTTYIDNFNRVLLTNQYAVTDYTRIIDETKPTGVPGIFFKYDIEPISVRITEKSVTFAKFLTRLCGLVGGVWVTAGFVLKFANWIWMLLDRNIGNSTRRLNNMDSNVNGAVYNGGVRYNYTDSGIHRGVNIGLQKVSND
ncbi:10155_t:CDS:2 [Racocetra fulgida]|uniref:10155_t:CDS:1 n=1 Tax=Racocetra fulgida TaxID=60492 RepID=A0A9N8ZH49_9GLOM|nr:10155_t:CDS:2 [Racocetra fulgida]